MRIAQLSYQNEWTLTLEPESLQAVCVCMYVYRIAVQAELRAAYHIQRDLSAFSPVSDHF